MRQGARPIKGRVDLICALVRVVHVIVKTLPTTSKSKVTTVRQQVNVK